MYVGGLVHGCQSWPPSPPSQHSKLAPESLELNANEGAASRVTGAGLESSETGAAAAVQERETTGPSWSPSFAYTRNVCDPADRPECVWLPPHDENAPPSSEHWNVAASLAPKANATAPDETTPDGPDEIETVGATVSTVHDRDTTAPRFPERSRPRTNNECAPWDSPEYVTPDRHDVHPSESRLHSNDDTGSFFKKVNDAVVDATRDDGPLVNDTIGATVSAKRTFTYIVPEFSPVPNVQIADASGASSQSISPECG